MQIKKMQRMLTIFVVFVTVFSFLFTPGAVSTTKAAVTVPTTFTILHTNDFHGNLEWKSGGSSSNPGSARVAAVVDSIRTTVGDANMLLVDAGDEMQGSLLSNIQHGKPVIAVYNEMSYDAATFGNHEFDWGQTVLADRTGEAAYPYLTANIVKNDTGNCSTAGWTKPDFADAPYQILTVGTAPNTVKVAVIAVTTTETPIITMASATAGLCFKDPADSIAHYYADMKATSDVIVVLSHLGYADGGYGYGIPIYGDQSLATKLTAAGTPVNLIIGGHSHSALATATIPKDTTTTVVQAAYNGRRVGRADITVNPDGKVAITWSFTLVPTAETAPVNAAVAGIISTYANDSTYQELISQEIGWTNVPITRNYDGNSLMGDFVNDAIYNDLNTDATPANDVDMVFNNPGGLRTDITCAAYPCLLTYGMMFSILPFGNQTVVGDMTGLQILELLNQSASLSKGALQPSGAEYKFYNYRVDTNPDPAPDKVNWKAWSWGAFDGCVINKTSGVCEPLDLNKTYRVATNEFLAPAGQDNFYGFKYMKNVTYWGDMLDGVNRWVNANYTAATPYNGALDGRITRDGNGDDFYDEGEIIPLTLLHHNDMHGNLAKGQYAGYTQLATLIKEERSYNPTRTLLLNSGDNIQGDGLTFFFKTSYTGKAVDGTPLSGTLTTNPVMAVMNAMNYDAMTLGNHEFNFGSDVFTGVLGQANFPLLQANIQDDGSYGLAEVGVQDDITKVLDGIEVSVIGIGNHRVPNYELPSNIPGLAFSDPLLKAQEIASSLPDTTDVTIALTHIGFTEDPKSVEVDKNVDTNMAATVTGLDAIIGGHSHTNPAAGFGDSKYLPTYVLDPDGLPVIINHAYRYNNTLGEIFLGLRETAPGEFAIVTRAGQYLTVATNVVEDLQIKAIVDPYLALFNTYNNTVIGQTTTPIDALKAYTQETNGANLQADASVAMLREQGIDVDFHLSGAMSNRKVADLATPTAPVTLKVSDMFSLMPYENSLVVMAMNGPQIKAVLERAYRNYYYYKYVPGYGGYSYYTTCMIDINLGGKITYNDLYPAAYDAAKEYVVSLEFDGQEVDFDDAETYYNISTVNYLAAGSCNFNNAGVSLWPLNQIVFDTQYYVRDVVIDYITSMGIVSPAIDGRLSFIYDVDGSVITINAPTARTYPQSESITFDFSAVDVPAGIDMIWADLDGVPVINGQVLDLYTILPGEHVFTVYALDKATNQSSAAVTFTVEATTQTLVQSLRDFYDDGQIDNEGVYQGLLSKLMSAMKAKRADTQINLLNAFISLVESQRGQHITTEAADMLLASAHYVIDHLQ